MTDIKATTSAFARFDRITAIALGVMLVAAVVYLRWQGRIWWCACGTGWPVSLHVQSSHNSQHLFDIYSFSHLLHGVLLYGIFRLFARRWTLPHRLLAATLVEVGWELLENSPIIIERYRAATVSLNYTGDSIANSLGDIASFAIGFFLTRKLGLGWSIALFVAVELIMLALIRDNLATNVLMILWPIEAVRSWQKGG